MEDVAEKQILLCRKYNAVYFPLDLELKVGISRNFFTGGLPLNGLHHSAQEETSGWYLWAGEELSVDPDFFLPLHAKHLIERCPQVVPYLGLAQGWRFLIGADGYEDVWYDENLLLV